MSEKVLNNENELLARLADGDEKALATLFDYYYAPLVYFAQGMVYNKEEAEDIVIKLFHKLWQHRTEYTTGISSLKNFLYVSLRHACIDYLRSSQRIAAGNDRLMKETATGDDSLQREIIEADLMRLIFSEVERLPEKYRLILKMFYQQQLSTEEMARQLHISDAAVRMQKKRAIHLLREMLKTHSLFPLILHLFKNLL